MMNQSLRCALFYLCIGLLLLRENIGLLLENSAIFIYRIFQNMKKLISAAAWKSTNRLWSSLVILSAIIKLI